MLPNNLLSHIWVTNKVWIPVGCAQHLSHVVHGAVTSVRMRLSLMDGILECFKEHRFRFRCIFVCVFVLFLDGKAWNMIAARPVTALDIMCKEKQIYLCRRRCVHVNKVVLKLKANSLNINDYFWNHFITHNISLNSVTLPLNLLCISTRILRAAHYYVSLSMCGMTLKWARLKLDFNK